MKYILGLILVFLSASSFAQKHHVFADVGWKPGLSLTYNYVPTRYLGLGVGLQGYKYAPTLINKEMFIPALYADLRLNIRPQKTHQFFAMWDIGMNFYQQEEEYASSNGIVYNVPKDNAVYTGWGIGYMNRVTKRGGGPYVSLKLVMNITKLEGYSFISQMTEVKQINGDGTVVFSLGFKI